MENELNELAELKIEVELQDAKLAEIENHAIALLSHAALTDSMRQIVCAIIVACR